MTEIIQAGKFFWAKGFHFASLKKALGLHGDGDFVFFVDKIRGIMLAMPPCPTADWQKHPSRSRFNEEGWYETNLQDFEGF